MTSREGSKRRLARPGGILAVVLALAACPPNDEAARLDVARCIQRCRIAHPEGSAFALELARACVCTEQVCGASCANSFCAATPHDPDAPCDLCMRAAVRHGGVCDRVEDECEEGLPDCRAHHDCVKACTGTPPGEHTPPGGRVGFVSPGGSPWNGRIVLQAFWWDYWNNNYPNGWYNYLADLAPRLRGMGVDAVWVPPSVKNANATGSNGYSPFDPYDLGDKFQRGSLVTRLGDKDEYLRMVAVMHANGIDVIQDIVLNHIDGAGSRTGAGGQDPAAWDDGRTQRYKNFRYVSFATPARDESIDDYLSRAGRWPVNWENFHPSPGRASTSGDWAVPYWGPDICYAPDCYGGSSNARFNPPQAPNYMRDHARAWLQWLKRQTGVDGFRFDAVKHFEPAVIEDLLWNVQHNADFASGGDEMFAVGEWVGGPGELDGWANAVQNRAGTFDFSLRQGLYEMLQGGGFFDLGSLPSRQQGNRLRTVPFVNNHDTMRPQRDASGRYTGWNSGNELAPHVDPFDPRLGAAYAVAMAVDGAPMIYFEDLFDIGGTGRTFTHDPTNTTDLPARDALANLIWCHQMLGFKHAPYLVRAQAPDLLVIERGGRALIGVSDHWSTWQHAWVSTSFPGGTQLHDYSGANTNDVTVQGDGRVELSVPPCNGSARRRCYAVWGPAGVTGTPVRPARATTQEWELADDLGDSNPMSLREGGALPVRSTTSRTAGRIFSDARKLVTVELYPTDPLRSLTVSVRRGTTRVATATGTGVVRLTYTPTTAGWLTIVAQNASNTNPSQVVRVRATYTAPAVARTASFPSRP